MLPEKVMSPEEPPSRWFSLVDEPETIAANGNGHTHDVADGPDHDSQANGGELDHENSKASIPGRYLDLDTELNYARVRFSQWLLLTHAQLGRHILDLCISLRSQALFNSATSGQLA